MTHHIVSIQELAQSEATIPPQLIEYMPDDYFTDSSYHIVSIQELAQSEATIPPQLIEYMPDDYFTDSSYLIVYTGSGTVRSHNPSPADRVHA